MKKLFKKLFRTFPCQWFIAVIVFIYCLILRLTCKIEFEGGVPLKSDKSPVIIAIWHGRILLAGLIRSRGSKLNALISRHNDGKLIAKFAKLVSVNVIHGSSSKGGVGALRKMLKALKMNENVLITPDGPRGPRMKITMGVIETARMSGAEIIPVTITATKYKIIKSWDRFLVPLPFCTIFVCFDESIKIAKNTPENERGNIAKKLEKKLITLQQNADKKAGFSTVISPAGVVK